MKLYLWSTCHWMYSRMKPLQICGYGGNKNWSWEADPESSEQERQKLPYLSIAKGILWPVSVVGVSWSFSRRASKDLLSIYLSLHEFRVMGETSSTKTLTVPSESRARNFVVTKQSGNPKKLWLVFDWHWHSRWSIDVLRIKCVSVYETSQKNDSIMIGANVRHSLSIHKVLPREPQASSWIACHQRLIKILPP